MQPIFKYRVPVHIAGWILFLALPLLLSPAQELTATLSAPGNLLSMALRNLLWMGLFYANLLYFTPALLQKKNIGLYILGLAVLIVMITLVTSRVHHLFFVQPNNANQGHPIFQGPPDNGVPPPDGAMAPPDNGAPPPGDFNPQRPFGPPQRGRFGPPGSIFFNLLISMVMISVSTSLVLWGEWLKTRAEESERAFQKVSSELAVLKLQISPHFLFNTLNNIRWLIRSGSDQAEASVVKLSSLLRYVLYQSDLEKVPLDKEAEQLNDYVALQKMRLVNTDAILFSIDGVRTGQMIVPLLLIPLVENVFKYGEFTEIFQNKITLLLKEDVMIFNTENKIAIGQEVKTGKDYGIGLENVRRRLSLHYPGQHALTITQADGVFKVHLEIILS